MELVGWTIVGLVGYVVAGLTIFYSSVIVNGYGEVDGLVYTVVAGVVVVFYGVFYMTGAVYTGS